MTIDELVDALCDMIDEAGDYDAWEPQTRVSWQEEVIRRMRNELAAREGLT